MMFVWLYLYLTLHTAVHCLSCYSAHRNFNQRHHLIIFGIPVISILGSHFYYANKWIIFSPGKPCLCNRSPQLFYFAAIMDYFCGSKNTKVLRTAFVGIKKLNPAVRRNFVI